MATFEPLPTIREYRKGNINASGDTLRVGLFDNSTAYTPDKVGHEFVDDIVNGSSNATELSDSTYSRLNVTGASVTLDSVDEEVVIDADDSTFQNLDGGEEIQGWFVYKQVGGDDSTPGDDPLIAIEDEVTNSNGNPVTTNGANVTIQYAGEGILNVNVTSV